MKNLIVILACIVTMGSLSVVAAPKTKTREISSAPLFRLFLAPNAYNCKRSSASVKSVVLPQDGQMVTVNLNVVLEDPTQESKCAKNARIEFYGSMMPVGMTFISLIGQPINVDGFVNGPMTIGQP